MGTTWNPIEYVKVYAFNTDTKIRVMCSSKVANGQHYVDSNRIWSFSGPYFPIFGLNTKIYRVNLRI